MNRDFILATLLSIGVHVAVLFGNFTGRVPSPAADDAEKETVIGYIFPLMPPDEPEVIETTDVESKPVDLALPTQTDLPQPVQPDSFPQKIQPPPPEGVIISKEMSVVPEVRNSGVFQGTAVFDPSRVDQVPTPRFQARPQYPFEMRRQGIAGEVVVDFIVDTQGEVRNAYALRSSQREFEAAAVAAVSKWKFRPGRKDGRDVPTRLQVPIVFTLNQE